MKIIKNKKQKGFTLIEILVVIGIIAILAAVVLVAINPARQFAQARNSQRVSNINAVLNAVGQRLADNKGVFAGIFGSPVQTCPDITSSALTVGTRYAIYNGTGGSGNWIDLSCVVPTYIPSFPTDPSHVTTDGNNTLYEFSIDANGRTTICAPKAAESAIAGSAEICVIR